MKKISYLEREIRKGIAYDKGEVSFEEVGDDEVLFDRIVSTCERLSNESGYQCEYLVCVTDEDGDEKYFDLTARYGKIMLGVKREEAIKVYCKEKNVSFEKAMSCYDFMEYLTEELCLCDDAVERRIDELEDLLKARKYKELKNEFAKEMGIN